MKSMFFFLPVVLSSALVVGLNACGTDVDRDVSESALDASSSNAVDASQPMRLPTILPTVLPTFAPTVIPRPRLPDLVAESFSFGAPVKVGTEIRVPATVVIRNIGAGTAVNAFKVAAQYTGLPSSPTTTFAVAFRVGAELWYPTIAAGFASGASRILSGTVVFPRSLSGASLQVRAFADSCSGDEFMPAYCRVSELRESNNSGAPVSLRLP
jgi:hypothetical protein